ncbi:MAG: hypothetical protein N0E56_15815 [Candidatus Thiodiazotropha endolucinida]|nr:hypothetical protein [Candidatus Thiodiazotropha taylori]MCW4268090.1 hypothetical protein [Candidatus Thiodiazotropha endolucinida]
MAGRPRYRITKMDFAAAKSYIRNAMTRGDISSVDGYIAFRNAETPEELQAWCDDYLKDKVFEKLKRAVFAARRRSRDYKSTRQKVGVDLDYYAHLHLSELAKELDMSLSDTVLMLEDVYWKAKGAGIV